MIYKKEIILHIGTYKTGTSSIQKAFKNYDDGETAFCSFTKTFNHSQAISTIFSLNPSKLYFYRDQPNKKEVKKLKKNYLKLLNNFLKKSSHKKLIISGESIGLLDLDEKKRMISYFNSKGYKVSAICIFRDPSSYTVSIVNQYIKSGRTLPIKVSLQYSKYFEGFEDITVADYSSIMATHGSVIKWFEDINKISLKINTEIKENRGITNIALCLILFFNKKEQKYKKNKNYIRARLAFVNKINDLVIKQTSKIERDHFNKNFSRLCLSLLSGNYSKEIEFVNKEFDFKYSINTNNDQSYKDLKLLLGDISLFKKNQKHLNAALKSKNISFKGSRFSEKLESLFLYYYHNKDLGFFKSFIYKILNT